MADVEISYGGSTIVSLNDSGTEVLETNGKFMTDDVTVAYTKSGGGGDIMLVPLTLVGMSNLLSAKTTAEIRAAYSEGKQVIFAYDVDGYYFSLLALEPSGTGGKFYYLKDGTTVKMIRTSSESEAPMFPHQSL